MVNDRRCRESIYESWFSLRTLKTSLLVLRTWHPLALSLTRCLRDKDPSWSSSMNIIAKVQLMLNCTVPQRETLVYLNSELNINISAQYQTRQSCNRGVSQLVLCGFDKLLRKVAQSAECSG